MDRRAVGAAGEDAVAAWYEGRGFRVLDRNWRIRDGEIDIVVHDRRTLVFCEVKTRRTDTYGVPAEAVTLTKQRRLRRLAAAWLAVHDPPVRGGFRFDVAAVMPDGRGGWQVDVVEDAF